MSILADIIGIPVHFFLLQRKVCVLSRFTSPLELIVDLLGLIKTSE